MKEQHPIDGLFARSLRQAEAPPPPGAWEGIVRQRDWAHLALLRLRRKWGWLALLLLAGGASTYLAMSPGAGPVAPAGPNPGMALTAQAAPPQADFLLAPGDPAAGTGTAQHATIAGTPGLHGPEAAPLPSHVRPASSATVSNETPAHALLPLAADLGAPSPAGARNSALAQAATEAPDQVKRPGTASALPARAALSAQAVQEAEADHAAAGAEPRQDLALLALRLPAQEPLASAAPLHASTPLPRPARRAWWVAATTAQYSETRRWRGDDHRLAKALQATEPLHRATYHGVLAGVALKGGWSLAAGLEHGAVRYGFRHLDRYREERDSVVTSVVTLNTQVVGSFTDTVSAVTEVQRTVVAVNRRSVLRVPVEAGWHRPVGRWRFGVRGGLALELSTLHGGATLVQGPQGTRSVDVQAAGKRTTLLASLGLGLDAGLALNERTLLWASPTFITGLFPLSPTDGSPYVLPQRTGLRLGLTYALSTTP